MVEFDVATLVCKERQGALAASRLTIFSGTTARATRGVKLKEETVKRQTLVKKWLQSVLPLSAFLVLVILTGFVSQGSEIIQVPACQKPGETIDVDLSTGQGGHAADPYWAVSLNGGSASTAYGTAKHPAWVGGNWIQPVNSSTAADAPAGEYVYELQFNVQDISQYSSIEVSGSYAADNRQRQALLNGVFVTACLQLDCFKALRTFNSTNVQDGLNTLSFQVQNKDSTSGFETPTGLLVVGSLKAACSDDATPKLPDLVITNVSFDEDCNLVYTVTNIGEGTANGPFAVSASSVLHGNPPTPSQVYGSGITNLAGNGAGTFTETWNGTLIAGDTLVLTVDSGDFVEENEESNNTFTIEVPSHCQAKPELVITELYFDEDCNLHYTIKNVGSVVAVGPFNLEVDPIAPPDPGKPEGAWNQTPIQPGSSLGPGQQYSGSFGPGWTSSGDTITATVDPFGEVDESVEGNNTFTIEVPESCRGPNPDCEKANQDKDLLSAHLAAVSAKVASADGLLNPETLNSAKNQLNGAIRDLEGLSDDLEGLFASVGQSSAAQRALQEARQLFGSALNALERALDKVEQAIDASKNCRGECNSAPLLAEASGLLQQADLALDQLDLKIFNFDVCM